MYFECDGLDDERIEIDNRENICSVCGKDYKHSKRYNWGEDKSIKEVSLITAHPTCRHLTNCVKELRNKLTDAEFRLFLLKTH